MSVTLLVTVCLLMHGFLCSTGQPNKGCMKWTINEDNVCCEACHPGNRLIKKCGLDPEKLCTPCETGTYTEKVISPMCDRCTQCVGALKELEPCTATKDTKCGCNVGLTCGNDHCSFCVKTCGKGEEPTNNRSCQPCPKGKFNDQIHQMCKPHSNECPNPGEYILTKGTAFSDINCTTISVKPTHKNPPHEPVKEWSLFLTVIIVMALVGMVIVIIITITTVAVKTLKKKKKTKKTEKVTKTPIIRTPTDDPRTLIAIECSFHEAQQEQGSSTESLVSKESTDRLIA